MAESSWPTLAGGHSITDQQWEMMVSAFTADGIIGNPADPAVVYGDSSGMQVKVRANKLGLVCGHGWLSGPTEFTRAVGANASGSTRIDLAILRFTRTTQDVTCVIRAGTPGAGTPTLTQDSKLTGAGVFEIPVAQVTVASGASSISAANVTNVAWYAAGDTVVTSSTGAPQPAASMYQMLSHYDTGNRFESVAGVWRRSPWATAWGVIGGQRYIAGSGARIVLGGTTAEFASAQTSGPVLLRANRRYRLRAFVRITMNTTGQVLVLRLRETGLTGTIRAEKAVSVTNTVNVFHQDITGEYTTGGADETKTFVVTANSSAGLWDLFNGDAGGHLVGVWVEDVGPAVPNVITTV